MTNNNEKRHTKVKIKNYFCYFKFWDHKGKTCDLNQNMKMKEEISCRLPSCCVSYRTTMYSEALSARTTSLRREAR